MTRASTHLLGVLVLSRAQEAGVGRPPESSPRREPAPWRVLALIGQFVFLRMAAQGAPKAFFNVHFAVELGVTTNQIGASVAAAELVLSPAAMLSEWIVARWG